MNNPLFDGMKAKYVGQGVNIFAALATVALISSLMRYPETGWLNVYYIHIAMTVCLVLLALFKARFSVNTQAFLLITAASIVAISSLQTFALISGGPAYFILAGVFMVTFYGFRVTCRYYALMSLLTLFTGALFALGVIELKLDFNRYIVSFSSWITILLGPFVISLFLFYIIGNMRKQLIISVNALDEAKLSLEQLAQHDSLTGLPNMRLIADRYEQLVMDLSRGGDPFFILLLDLDGFKQVNDRFGHMEGNALLQELSSRLVQCLRETDTAARLGGDEFLVILRHAKSLSDVIRTARSIVSKFNEEFATTNGELVTVGVSMGGCEVAEVSISLESALHKADVAMYKQKMLGKNGLYIDEENFFKC